MLLPGLVKVKFGCVKEEGDLEELQISHINDQRGLYAYEHFLQGHMRLRGLRGGSERADESWT
jgi:hypothetical protein